MTANKKRIGIFGGSFNPVHNGHVAIAKAFAERLALDLLLIIPNRMSPMKNRNSVSGSDRLKMLEIAFAGAEGVEISDIELNRAGISYTCDTVAEIKGRYPDSELFLLIGDDWADSFVKWKNFRHILQNARLVIAARCGRDITPALDKLQQLCGVRPIELGNETVPISSGELRLNTMKDQIPCGVYEYIQEKGLY